MEDYTLCHFSIRSLSLNRWQCVVSHDIISSALFLCFESPQLLLGVEIEGLKSPLLLTPAPVTATQEQLSLGQVRGVVQVGFHRREGDFRL